MTRTYYKGAAGCVIVCDITNRKSFEQAKVWKQDLDAKVFLPNCECLPCILVANKVCLSDRVNGKVCVCGGGGGGGGQPQETGGGG